MVNKLRVKLLTFALQLWGKARHNGLLCCGACLHRGSGKLRYVYLPLKLRPADKLLGVTKLSLRRSCLRATKAGEVKSLQVNALRAPACKPKQTRAGASTRHAKRLPRWGGNWAKGASIGAY